MTTPPAALSVAQEIMAVALRHVRDAELFWASEEAVGASCADGRLRPASKREAEGVALRIISSGRVGFAVHVGPLPAAEPSALLRQATKHAAEGPPAPPTFWKERESAPSVLIWDDNIAGLTAADLDRQALAAAVRLGDLLGPVPREVAVRRVIRRTALITRTFEKHSEKTLFQCRAQAGPLTSSPATLVETWASCRLPDDILTGLGDLAWKAALAKDPIRVDAAGTRDVVLSPRAAATLLRWLCAGLGGHAVAKGASPLAQSMGKRVVDARISLADDPTMAWSPAGGPFDGEGVARRRNVLIQDGVLQGFLLDLSSAWALQLPPTASAIRAMDTPPTPGLSQLDLAPGDTSQDELIAISEGGLYIDALADDIEPDADGNFQAAVRCGYAIRSRRPAGWIDGIAMKGNVYELLSSHVSGVAADRVTIMGGRCGAIGLRGVELVSL